VVFGGLLIATVLSLFVVPVFYVVMKSLLGQAGSSSDGGSDSNARGSDSGLISS
jgi:HAE1 family hydrophobic/amphiphilic exporter-1